jgi:hypothetical protein
VVNNLDRAPSTGIPSGVHTTGRFLPIHVVATTDRGTRAALAAACRCATDLNARVALLVPHVVPYAQPLEHPAGRPQYAGERFGKAAEALGLDVTIRVCLCRSVLDVMALLPPDALVLVGGRRRWWRTRENRLAQALARRGFRALLVDSHSFAPARKPITNLAAR